MNTVQQRLKKALLAAGMKEEMVADTVSYYTGQPDFSDELPIMCPICKSTKLIDVMLSPLRKAKYCTSDRSVFPYPIKGEVSQDKVQQTIQAIKMPVKESSIFAG